MIIDSQVHIWNALNPGASAAALATMITAEFAETARLPGPLGPFSAEVLLRLMADAGVDRAILVPPAPAPATDQNDLSLDAARRYPDRFAVVGRIAVDQPDKQRLAAWRLQPGMLGFRLSSLSGAAATLDTPSLEWVWETAEDANIPVMVYAPNLLPAVKAVASRHPGLSILLDHLALPLGVVDHAIEPYIDALLPLASLPNIAVKASAVPRYSTQPYPFPAVHEPVRRVVEAFGPQRVFWGSDISTLKCPYRDVVKLFTEALDFLSEPDKVWIMGKGLAQWLRWPVAAS